MLTHLIEQCKDFKEQKTNLEQLADEIYSNPICNITILFTPKPHYELTGDGIEYSWGAFKRIYQKKTLTLNHSTVNFEQLVKLSINNVSKQIYHRFSAKSKGHMLVYSHKEK